MAIWRYITHVWPRQASQVYGLFTCSKTRKSPVCNVLYAVWMSFVLSNWTECWSGCYNLYITGVVMPSFVCWPALLIPIASSSLTLSEFYPSCSVHSANEADMGGVFKRYRHGLCSPAVSQRAVGQIHAHSLCAARRKKPNRDSFYIKLWFKEWEHGLVWSKNGPISVTVILRRFVNAIQPQNCWHFQILTDFFHNMCKMHIRCTSHKS